MAVLQDYIDAFRENSIKITPQRLAIFKVLEGNKTHPSAEEIYNQVRSINSAISFATVYNTIDKLCELKLLLKLNIEDEKKHFDPDTTLHHHFLCKECRKIIDIFDEFEIEPADKVMKKVVIESCQVNFYGICSECC